MIDKKEIRCLRTLKNGPFFQEFLVCFDSSIPNKKRYSLRAMSKKLIVQNKVDEEMVINELYIRSNIRHPFLINQVCAFQDYDNLFYISEYAPIKLLKNDLLPRKFHSDVVRFYAAEIFSCIKYMHTKNQIYTFLSPDSILLGEDGHIKLDYSFCNCLNESEDDVLNNIEYASLDYLTKNEFSIAGDYWSLGIIVYLMAVGYTPFGSETFEETVYSMKKTQIEFPDFLDSETIDFILLLLRKKLVDGSAVQVTAENIARHPFFKNIDWKALESRQLHPPHIPSLVYSDFQNAPTLSALYTTDFIVGDKDGYGSIFSGYNTVNFLKTHQRHISMNFN
jgi:serine/threonine protein kinase